MTLQNMKGNNNVFHSVWRVNDYCNFVHLYCNIGATRPLTCSDAEPLVIGDLQEHSESCPVRSSSRSSNLDMFLVHGYIPPKVSKAIFL